ncbi:MAG TPA: inositol monophosphatase family protein [Enhygromyxa sp.]|nr:inositol monophosphatase family protein [Enhygromyxa sp.]
MNEALALIQRAARAGGQILVAAFAALDSLHIRAKGPADYVSEADLDAEAAIRSMLTAALPDVAWRGEESGYAEASGPPGTSAREWVVDPLDGTTNFLSGIPHFAVSIALREDGETVCGVVYQPLTDEMFAAARGAGATRNGVALRVSSRDRWEQVVLGTGVPHRGSRYHRSFAAELATVRERVAGIRRFGSAALDLAWVACGRYDGFWERGLHPWDVAAGNLLVREAGGVVTGIDEQHDPDTGISVTAATPWLHAELVGLLHGATSK